VAHQTTHFSTHITKDPIAIGIDIGASNALQSTLQIFYLLFKS